LTTSAGDIVIIAILCGKQQRDASSRRIDDRLLEFLPKRDKEASDQMLRNSHSESQPPAGDGKKFSKSFGLDRAAGGIEPPRVSAAYIALLQRQRTAAANRLGGALARERPWQRHRFTSMTVSSPSAD